MYVKFHVKSEVIYYDDIAIDFLPLKILQT